MRHLKLSLLLLTAVLLAIGSACNSGATDDEDDQIASINPVVVPGDDQVEISWSVELGFAYAVRRTVDPACNPMTDASCVNNVELVAEGSAAATLGKFLDNDANTNNNGPDNFTTYYYWFLKKGGGTTAISGPIAATPLLFTMPTAADVGFEIRENEVDVTWDAKNGHFYNILVSTDSGCNAATNIFTNNCADSSSFRSATSPWKIPNLTSSSTYRLWFEVYTRSNRDYSNPPFEFSPKIDIVLPTDFSADSGDLIGVLNWTAGSGFVYNYYRSTDPGCDPTVDINACQGGFSGSNISPGHRDRVPVNGVNYQYWLEVERSGVSKVTGPVVASPTVVNLEVPQTFDATSGVEMVSLTWDTRPLYTYNLHRSTNGACDLQTLTNCDDLTYLSKVAPVYDDGGLTGGTEYFYWLEALHGGRLQTVAGPASARTQSVLLAVPNNFSATAGEMIVTLSWTPAPGLSYDVHRTTDDATACDGSNFATCADIQTFVDVTSDYDDTASLVANTDYYYWIETKQGAYSTLIAAPVTATPLPIVIELPTGFAAAAAPLQIDLSWNQATDARTEVKVHKSTDLNCSTANFPSCAGHEEFVMDNTADTYADTNVVFGTNYYYWLVFSRNGLSEISSRVSATPNNATVILPALTATSGELAVSLDWTVTAGHTYNIHRSSDANCNPNTLTTCTGDYDLFSNVSPVYSDTGLTLSTDYNYWIEASYSGNSTISASAVTARANPVPLVFPGAGRFLTNPGNFQVTLIWDTQFGQTYNLFRSRDATCDVQNRNSCSGSFYVQNVTSGYTFTGLLNNEVYYFWLEVSKNGYSAFHSDVTSDTPVPPAASGGSTSAPAGVQMPTDLVLVGTTGSIQATWTADSSLTYRFVASTDANCNTGLATVANCSDVLHISPASSPVNGTLTAGTYFVWLLAADSQNNQGTLGPNSVTVP